MARWREERDGENTEEVKGRSLASIRERDADRVGESWVRSHKEVDTRRHLNPPSSALPPSRRSLPPRLSHRFVPPSLHPSPPFPPRTSDRPSSSPVRHCVFLFHLLSLRSPYSRYILFLFLPFTRPPSLFSLSRSLASLRRSLYEALFPLSQRGNPPQKHEARS